MKRILFALTLLSLLLIGSHLHAQAITVDPAVQAAVNAAVPAQYAGYTSLGLIALMMLGRFLKAMADGRGIKGWLSAIWLGTNTPHILIACLCLLTLPACQNAANNARLSRIVDLSLAVAERKGVITSADAAAVREAKTIILTPDPVALPALEVSGK